MSGCVQPVKKSREAEQHGAGANCRQGLHLRGPLTQPVEDDRVLQLSPRAPSAWGDKNIEMRAVLKRVVRYDFHAARCGNCAGTLCNEQYLKGRGLLTPFLFVQACY